ncbi:MAG: TonB-dependent receptor [Bacteroidota bacterium]|nr:TonB-dependent receptor [Bacteroidota bacterium]
MKFQKALYFILFFLNYALLVTAQQDSVELENVILTANQSLQHQKESGRNVLTIKGESMALLPVHSIDELLRYLPGIEVQQRGPQGAQSDITIRGGTFQQVLVIIDGVKLNDPLTGHFNNYIPINPAEIDRIEILKGAASAVYGSEAVGGVVHIITKTFTAYKTPLTKLIKGRIVTGENNLVNADAYARWVGQTTMVSGGITTNNAKGEPLRGTTGFFHLTTAHIALAQQLKKDWTLRFRTAVDYREFNAQNFYTTFSSDTSNEKVNSWWSHLNLSKKTATGTLNFDVAYKKLRDQYLFRPSAVPNDNKTNLFTSQLYYSSLLSKNHSYTTGLQLHRKQISSNDRGNHRLWHGAAYVIFRHQLKNNFYLNESIRLDWDESYGSVLVPQINMAWSPSKITLRAAAGKSIRDADFTERYNNYNKTLVTSGRIGNPDLAAEYSWNVEAGADYTVSANWKISATVFYRDHTNLIDWSNTPYAAMPRKINLSPAGNYALAKNVEKVKTSGAELDMIYTKKISESSNLMTTLGFTWLQSENKDSIPSFYISSHAKYLVNFSAAYTVKPFLFSLTGLYKNRNEQKAAAINAAITPSYFILNAKIGHQLPGKFGRLFVQADNVFDKQYSDLLGSQMPGRWLSGGFEIAL